MREDLVIKRTFYLPAYAVAAVWLGLGLEPVLRRVCRASIPIHASPPTHPSLPIHANHSSLPSRASLVGTACVSVLLAALPLAWHYRECDKSGYYFAEDYGRNLLRTLRENSVFIPSSDHATFPVIYLTAVDGLRPDVLIADRYGTIEDATLRRLFEREAAVDAGPPLGASRAKKVRYLIEHSHRPVYLSVKEPLGDSPFELATSGLLFEAVPRGHVPGVERLEELWKSYEWHPGTFAARVRDYTADMVLADVAFARGRHLLLLDKKAEALEELRRAGEHAWGIKEVQNNLGGYLAESGLAAEAIPYLLAAWEVEPGYAMASRNLAMAHLKGGKYAEGLRWFALELEKRPGDPALLLAAARGARALGRTVWALGYYLRLEHAERQDLEVLREAREYLRSQGWSADVLADYEAKEKAIVEAREKQRDALVKAMEEGELGPRPPVAGGAGGMRVPTPEASGSPALSGSGFPAVPGPPALPGLEADRPGGQRGIQRGP